MITTDLPPSARAGLAAWGWVALAGSLALAATLIYFRWEIAVLAYLMLVCIGYVVGLPGGMRYQGDIDAYLAKHPTLSRADLPWPAQFSGLDRKRASRYALRGLVSALQYALLVPVLLLMGILVSVRLLSMESLQSLYREDEAE